MKELIIQLKEIIGERKIFTKELREEIEKLGFEEAELSKKIKFERMVPVKKNIRVKIGLIRKEGTFIIVGINKNKAYVKEI